MPGERKEGYSMAGRSEDLSDGIVSGHNCRLGGETHIKIGIIRCEEYSAKCAGKNCFPAVAERRATFAGYADELQLVGFDTCGGCGRNSASKIVARANKLRDSGAEAIHFGNCLVNACPWADLYGTEVAEATGLPVVRGTH